jgi:hypothetical protein
MPPRSDDRLAIKDEEDLWRRVFPDKGCFVPTDSGTWRPSSAIFLDRTTREVSVHISSLTTAETVLASFPHHSLAAIKAAVPREHGCAVTPDPIPDDASHALICPPPGSGINKIKTIAREMARKATWVVLRDPPY